MQLQIVIIPAMRKVNYDPADDIPPISALATNLLPITGKLPTTTVAKFVVSVARSPASRARRGAGSLSVDVVARREGIGNPVQR